MAETIGSFAYFLGSAFLSSPLGAAELMLGLLVGVGFLVLPAGAAVSRVVRHERVRDEHPFRTHRA